MSTTLQRAFFLALFACGCGAEVDANDTDAPVDEALTATATLQFAVKNSAGTPIHGATTFYRALKLDAPQSVPLASNANGYATFPGLAPGVYHVTVGATGYWPSVQEVSLKAGVTSRIPFALTSRATAPSVSFFEGNPSSIDTLSDLYTDYNLSSYLFSISNATDIASMKAFLAAHPSQHLMAGVHPGAGLTHLSGCTQTPEPASCYENYEAMFVAIHNEYSNFDGLVLDDFYDHASQGFEIAQPFAKYMAPNAHGMKHWPVLYCNAGDGGAAQFLKDLKSGAQSVAAFKGMLLFVQPDALTSSSFAASVAGYESCLAAANTIRADYGIQVVAGVYTDGVASPAQPLTDLQTINNVDILRAAAATSRPDGVMFFHLPSAAPAATTIDAGRTPPATTGDAYIANAFYQLLNRTGIRF